MKPMTLWERYAAIWSLPAEARASELDACVANDVVYVDPNGTVRGRQSLSDYMGGFQKSAPGARFEIASVLDHDGGMLALWSLVAGNGTRLQAGASFALPGQDGRLKSISGFFPLPPTASW
jgi:SnoaL-like protein